MFDAPQHVTREAQWIFSVLEQSADAGSPINENQSLKFPRRRFKSLGLNRIDLSSAAPTRDCLLRQSEKEPANAGHEYGGELIYHRPFGKSLTRH